MFEDDKAVEILKHHISEIPPTLMVLGSGWNKVLESVEVEQTIDYSVLFGASAGVPGHEGALMTIKHNDKRVAVMSGRFHMYEGYKASEVTLPIRVLNKSGVNTLILTAAAGALNEKFNVGDFIVISDLLTLLMPDNPLIGPKFTDMSQVFDPELRKLAMKTASELDLSWHEGIYSYYHGPNYETPADKMGLKFLGADITGMSTVPETIMARYLGMKVLGLSLVTNLAFVKHKHEEVVAEAKKASEKMTAWLMKIIEAI